MKKIITILIIVLGSVGGYAWYSPYIAMNNIHNGMIEKDADVIIEHVDFPALRESVKVQFMSQMMKKLNDNGGASAVGALGAMMGAKMADGILDTYVTPSGIRSLMESGKFDKNRAKDTIYTGEYIKYDKFKISISQAEKEDKLSFFMRRDGLIEWKIDDIKLPENIMKR